MTDREDPKPSKSLGSRLRGAFGKARETGAASLRVAQRSVSTGVAGAGERLKSGQAAVGHAVEARRFVKQAQEAQERGNHAMAFRLLEENLGEHGGDLKYVLALWAAAIACEQTDDAVPAMKKLVRSLAGSGKLLRAAEAWMELQAGAPGTLVDAGSLVRMAPALLEDGQQKRAIEALRQALDPNQVALSPGLAVRVTEMARELDPGVALAAARRALENPELNAAKRERLQALSGELEAEAAKVPSPDTKADQTETGAEPAPAAGSIADAEIPGLDAEDLAQEIGAATAGPTVDETVSQRFVDLGEGEDLDLDLGESGVMEEAVVGEEFVDLAPEELASRNDGESALSIETIVPPSVQAEPSGALDPGSPEAPAQPIPVEPESVVESATPSAPSADPDGPFELGGLDLGASSDDLGLPDGEDLDSDLDLDLTMPDAPQRDLAEETIFDGGDLGSLGGEALADDDAVDEALADDDAVVLDSEELAALDDDLPMLDALDASDPVVPDDDLGVAMEDDPFVTAAPDDDPFAAPEPEVLGEVTGDVLAEDPAALADIATPVVDSMVERVAPAARFAEVKVMEGAPRELSDVGIVLDLPGGRRGRVEYAKIEALAVAEVGDLAAHPVVVVDLLMNWTASEDVALRAVRLRSDGFDPCAVMPEEERPAAAFRAFIAALLARTGATPLPDADLRTQRFEDLATYQRELLGVGD